MSLYERHYRIARPRPEGWSLVEQDERGRYVWISDATYATRDEARAALAALKRGTTVEQEVAAIRAKRAADAERKRKTRAVTREVARMSDGDLKIKDASSEAIAASMDAMAGVPVDEAVRARVAETTSYDHKSIFPWPGNEDGAVRYMTPQEVSAIKRRAIRNAARLRAAKRVRHTCESGRGAR